MFAQADALRSSFLQLEGLLEEYPPLMSGSMGKFVDRAIKYGTALAEVSPPIPSRNKTLTPFS